MTREQLTIEKKELGKRISELCLIMSEKKRSNQDSSAEIAEKIALERRLIPIKERLSKEQIKYEDALLKVFQHVLPNEIKIKCEVYAEKFLRSELKINQLKYLDFSIYNSNDLEILSSKYPQLIKQCDKMIDAARKQKLEARKLIATLNTRLTPDEQYLVKEVKEFLQNIANL